MSEDETYTPENPQAPAYAVIVSVGHLAPETSSQAARDAQGDLAMSLTSFDAAQIVGKNPKKAWPAGSTDVHGQLDEDIAAWMVETLRHHLRELVIDDTWENEAQWCDDADYRIWVHLYRVDFDTFVPLFGYHISGTMIGDLVREMMTVDGYTGLWEGPSWTAPTEVFDELRLYVPKENQKCPMPEDAVDAAATYVSWSLEDSLLAAKQINDEQGYQPWPD